jgi:uncharacterized protein (TIGR02444 family)
LHNQEDVDARHKAGHDDNGMTQPDTDQNRASSFWQFSLQFYRRPGAEEACIALQEQCDVDVNLLLFLLWQAADMRQASAAEIEALQRAVAPWRAATILPLRALRRALKHPPALVEGAAAEAFRTRIKTVELEAERLQQEAMSTRAQVSPLSGTARSAEEAARTSLAAYAAICPTPFPEPIVRVLLAAFARPRGN